MNRQEFMRRLEQLLEGIPEEEKSGSNCILYQATLRMQEKKMKRR